MASFISLSACILTLVSESVIFSGISASHGGTVVVDMDSVKRH